MSRLWPHAPYAEDNAYGHAILTTHVFTRALTTGTLIGPAIATPLYALRHFKLLLRTPNTLPLSSTILRSSGVGAAITMAAMTIVLPGRMWGKEKIEWQDRSWRLLENKGQIETDDWTYGGMVLGGLAYGLRRQQMRVFGWRGAVGSLGLGSVAGMFGYLGWSFLKGNKVGEHKGI